MHIAAANGYDEVVEYLLDHGAKINMLDHDAWQPIHAAACWGHVSHQQNQLYFTFKNFLYTFLHMLSFSCFILFTIYSKS